MKGVILAGGTGSRLHPLTRITNKHLLPIHDRPMVTYAIEALVNAGLTELMLVTGGTHAGEFFRLLGDRICVMLADNVLEGSLRPAVQNFSGQERGARILLSPVEEVEHLQHLGVPELNGDGRVMRILEKPSDPPSRYAVTGIYFYDESVWDVIPTLKPSGRGELEITDVNNWYVEQGTMEYDVLEGFWGDAGESIDAYYEVNDFVRANGVNKT